MYEGRLPGRERGSRRMSKSFLIQMSASMVMLAISAGSAIFFIHRRREATLRINSAQPSIEQVLAVTQRATDGDKTAQMDLFEAYRAGWGVERNDKEAVRWVTAAAGQGDAFAMMQLAECYLNADGVARDPAAAADWMRKSAELGCVEAQYYHGVFRIEGLGGAADREDGYMWVFLSADAGYGPAMLSLTNARAGLTDAQAARARERAETIRRKIGGPLAGPGGSSR